MKTFNSLTEREILALAISLEEEDARVYDDFRRGICDMDHTPKKRQTHFKQAAARTRTAIGTGLLDLVQAAKFGEHVPLIRRQDVRGFVNRRPVWLVAAAWGSEAVRKNAEEMETGNQALFYRKRPPGERPTRGVRQLLGDLAEEERHHAAETAGEIARPAQLSDEGARANACSCFR
jgi:erythrin-vacuolar iron transport family protein